MKDAQPARFVFIPIFNGTYFNGLFKLVSRLSDNSALEFIFFFGSYYPNQEKHLALLSGRYDFQLSQLSGLSFIGGSKILTLARKYRVIDELLNFVDVAIRIRILKKELHQVWGSNRISLCLFPADNRYLYPFISNFAISRSTPVVIAPHWFAGPKEIEQALGHSKIYHPSFLERSVVRLIAPEYLRYVTRLNNSFFMIPIRFSEILIAWLLRCIPPEPWTLHSGFANRIFVETASTYEFATELGFDERQLALTGSIFLDEIELETTVASKNIHVLVAVAPDMFSSRADVNLQFADYREYLFFLCNELMRFGYGDAVFSMHPSDAGEYHDLISGFGFEISKEPIHLLLVHTKIFLATISATIQWANYLSIPTVNFDFYQYDYPDYLNLPLVVGVQDKQKLIEKLNQAEHLAEINSTREVIGHISQVQRRARGVDMILAEISRLVEGSKNND